MTTRARWSIGKTLLLSIGLYGLASLFGLALTEAQAAPPAATRPDPRPATSQVDDPALPRVLILGDSISMGYTGAVQKLLKGKANVHRPAENCQHSAYGLSRAKQWIGTGHWDVIHFNFGIWDTHYLSKTTGSMVLKEDGLDVTTVRLRHTPEQYRENLAGIVKALQGTGARLVWASTTPILSRTGDRFEDIRRLNDVAAGLMKENGIPVNDLYAVVLPEIAKWQSADKCHFTAQGSNLLAEKVAQSILDALSAQPRSPDSQPATRLGAPRPD